MILVDTNVLVALVDERDGLRERAMADLGKLKGPFGVLDAVLVETHFLLDDAYLRKRMRFALSKLAARHVQLQPDWWDTVFDWLEKYERHEPDLCDAMLVVAAARADLTVWTYDREFRQVWRRPDGRALRLAGSPIRPRRRAAARK
jgi:predicted nucleic acid-binding protein